MTTVHIPPVLDGAGYPVAATCAVRLVRADGTPVLGFVGEALAAEYQTQSIPAIGLDLTLAAQDTIALPDGAATWYAIEIATAFRTETYPVQVPTSAQPVTLHTLVGATVIDPADLLTGRLLTLAERAAIAAATAPPTADNPFLTLADRPT